MVTDKVAQREIQHFRALRPIPDEVGRKEIGEAMKTAQSEEHLKAAVELIRTEAQYYPTVRDILDALERAPVHVSGCLNCDGLGLYYPKGFSTHVGAMAFCSCAAGQAKREAVNCD